MKFVSVIFSSLIFFCFSAGAQMGLEGFSSGRYEIRKVKKTPRKPSSETKPVETPVSSAPPVVKDEPGIAKQVESLLTNEADRVYDFYREQTQTEDVRNNKLEIDVLPVVAYADSQSNYSYRGYQSFFEALKVKAAVWMTPIMGVSAQFMFSTAADIDVVGGTSRVPTKFENLELAFNLRNFSGLSRSSSSVEYSVLYSENKVNPESSNSTRSRLKSSGIGVGLKLRIPTSDSYAWTFVGNVFPRVQHSEQATSSGVHSGSAVESIRIGFGVGGEYQFNRKSQIIWTLDASSERNSFDGEAGLKDPKTGSIPTNVSVTNSAFMFSLGYRWGH